MASIRKRFIAGAICPKCKSQDTLMMWREDKIDVVECVNCGDQQRQTGDEATGHVRQKEQVIGIFTPE
ncbi:TPA: YheV family putative zinc ribbon protein [Providencia rettgeri]